MLQELGRGHKVAIFVLDEFDLFAKKAKQTTLYNLLDAMQSAGMQVICMPATKQPNDRSLHVACVYCDPGRHAKAFLT